MGFFDNISSDEEDNGYNPYDHYANNRIRKCKRGEYITRSWCCRACWVEQRNNIELEKEMRKNIFNLNFDDYYSDNNNYYFKKEEEQSVPNIDWRNLNLIPPKTLKEIKKQYRKLALLYHPDKPRGNHEKFIKIKNSYENLYNLY